MVIDTVCKCIINKPLLASVDGIAYMQELISTVSGIAVMDTFKKQPGLFLVGKKLHERTLQLSKFGRGITAVVGVDYHGAFSALDRVTGQQPALLSIETKGCSA